MQIRWPSSSGPYFALAALFALLALVTQFELHVPSRERQPVEALVELAERNDLNLVFLLVDTLRAHRMSLYGYSRPTTPVIDEAAAYGIVFEDVVAPSSWTKTSMASLWTATYPAHHGVLRYNHVLPEAAVMPAERLRDAGYRTVGLWRNGWVEGNFGFGQGFATYLRPTPGAARVRMHREARMPSPIAGSDEDLTLSAVDFLDRFGDERFFLYLHYMDVHQYVYDDEAAIFGTAYPDAYDQAIRWTDRLIGALLGELEERDLLKRTLVVIASDHGEAFGEHGHEGHARDLYDEVTRVPLILLPPFLLDPGIRVETTVSNVDVWPTLLELLGLPPLPGVDGRSLLPLVLAAGSGAEVDPDLARPVFAQIAHGWGRPRLPDRGSLISITHDGARLITSSRDTSSDGELFDRRSDPGEERDLFETRPDLREGLHAHLDAYLQDAEPPWGSAPEEVELDELRLNQLRALGYVLDP